jgi:hypothetical protein
MNDLKMRDKAIKEWPDDKAREYLDRQEPDDRMKWVVLDESGLYGYSDHAGTQFACADDDELRAVGITEFLIRNGGAYTSNA